MSIINDALKKTQDNLENKEKKSEMQSVYDKLHHKKKPNEGDKPKKDEEQKPLVNNFLGIIIFIVLIIAAGFFAYKNGLVPKGLDHKATKMITQNKNFTGAKSRPPTKVTLNQGSIKINGIMSVSDTIVVVIDNKIYRVGDTVQGNKITFIDKKKIELENTEGKTLTFNID